MPLALLESYWMRILYFDHATATPMAGSVRDAMQTFFSEQFASPAANHAQGRVAAEAVEDVRGIVAGMLGSSSTEVVLTAGWMESCNLGILGAARATLREKPVATPHAITTRLEAAPVAGAIDRLEQEGWAVTRLACDRRGIVGADAVQAAVRPSTRLVSVCHASWETGIIQPIRQIASVCANRGIRFHSDASQSIGKITVQSDALGVDLLSFGGHTLHGPKGAGVLYVRHGVALEPLLFSQEGDSPYRPAMDDVASVVGLGQAIRLASDGMVRSQQLLESLGNRLVEGLRQQLGDRFRLVGEQQDRLPHLFAIGLRGVPMQKLFERFVELQARPLGSQQAIDDAAGISPALEGMGWSPKEAACCLRIALAWTSTPEEIDRLINGLAEASDAWSVAD
ncbi:MAG: cysteine desulfurase family protein [Pirellulaceae bacterium]